MVVLIEPNLLGQIIRGSARLHAVRRVHAGQEDIAHPGILRSYHCIDLKVQQRVETLQGQRISALPHRQYLDKARLGIVPRIAHEQSEVGERLIDGRQRPFSQDPLSLLPRAGTVSTASERQEQRADRRCPRLAARRGYSRLYSPVTRASAPSVSVLDARCIGR